MKNFWNGLDRRERLFISFGSAILILILGYVYVWNPVISERIRLRPVLSQLESDSAWMRKAVGEISRLKALVKKGGIAGAAPQQSLENDIAQSGAFLDAGEIELTLQGERTVSVFIASANFSKVLVWLEDLQKNRRVQTSSLTIINLAKQGYVSVRAVMERPY